MMPRTGTTTTISKVSWLTFPPTSDPAGLLQRLAMVAGIHDVLRMKGFVEVSGKPMRLLVQGVGPRFRQQFERPWAHGEERRSRLVVIGEKGLDRAAIAAAMIGLSRRKMHLLRIESHSIDGLAAAVDLGPDAGGPDRAVVHGWRSFGAGVGAGCGNGRVPKCAAGKPGTAAASLCGRCLFREDAAQSPVRARALAGWQGLLAIRVDELAGLARQTTSIWPSFREMTGRTRGWTKPRPCRKPRCGRYGNISEPAGRKTCAAACGL